ncbi:hypothetical protein ASPWEDRAFT_120274 [Aspergillus wentii DTO 134E9]|uniref:Pheromone-regulated membrane protein n=1 Tax=Aspergillus wentii DTO 134E9 TaxID=1073089 RepID=A0A1L9R6I6_ASPWE|nr:uncharacterized protein ASPWEDRAFT_120274 [Aspergillus wentii DTO 134E9]OJJ30519.1 hypothetical protein ASPWEDRAFT_120274 [Aspergillus wentii DTO 134E9]
MLCCGDREKGSFSEEKWDHVNIGDFKSESCLAVFSYIWLWIFLIVSLAVYGVDTFTAVNLLAFSRWAGQIEPAIPFNVSRWIFAICIIISFVLLVFRWARAIRAIRSRSIAQSYLDSLAMRVQSIRMGKKGRGWRRFLVFAELTKSKKGAEYVALFAYFSFESWMNTVFADGPRQVVNAITLYSVMQMNLLPGGENASSEGGSGASQFFNNIKIMAEDNDRQAVVLFGMLFTLVIWVLSVLKLMLAVVLYLIFLFHHIPAEDGTLKTYCRRKINKRVMRVVGVKVNKALAKGVALKNMAPTQPNLGANAKPTLPSFGGTDADKGPIVTTISRSTTQTTLPPYTSRPGTAAPDQNPTLPEISWSMEKPPLSRTTTQTSAYSESASMSGSAATAYSPLDRGSSPAPPVPPLPSNIPTSATRTNTPMSRPGTTQPRFTPAPPSSINGSARATPAAGYRYQNEAQNPYGAYPPQNSRSGTPYRTYTPANDPHARSMTPGVAVSDTPSPARTFSPASHIDPYQAGYSERSFTPATQSATPRPPPSVSPDAYTARSYTPYNPSATPQPQQTGYAAFNPTLNSNPVESRSQTPSSPGYAAFNPSNITPSNDHGGPAPVRAYSPQPPSQPYGRF